MPEPRSSDPAEDDGLPPIPSKRYFSIGEVSELCGVKPHVLRYWEQEFPQLKPVKRRGNRRYYQQHDVRIVRQIRALLYHEGFTIGGARQRMAGKGGTAEAGPSGETAAAPDETPPRPEPGLSKAELRALRHDLEAVLDLLKR